MLDGPAPVVPEQPEWSRINVWAVVWWDTAWKSPVSALWRPEDVQALARLAMLHGQVATGLNDKTLKLLGVIQQLEDRFWLSPRARFLGGIVIPELDKPEVVDKPATSERRQRLKVV